MSKDSLTIMVSNAGCSLDPQAATHLFDRFWRGDVARTITKHHCGLGLSLCRDVMQVLGGSITATITDAHFTIRISLPVQMIVS